MQNVLLSYRYGWNFYRTGCTYMAAKKDNNKMCEKSSQMDCETTYLVRVFSHVYCKITYRFKRNKKLYKYSERRVALPFITISIMWHIPLWLKLFPHTLHFTHFSPEWILHIKLNISIKIQLNHLCKIDVYLLCTVKLPLCKNSLSQTY